MMGDLQVHLPIPHWVSSNFDQNSMTPIPHHPYLPDLSQSNIYLFPLMKKFL